MRKDKNTIINNMVDAAADIMEAHKEFNELVIEQFVASGKSPETVTKLTETNKRIEDAVGLIRELGGCWA